eukprot:c17561_g1_i1 orf=219-1892(+)
MASEAAEPPLSPSPEQEAFELSTTVDPSYIIQLIRQLLPPAHSKESVRQLKRKHAKDVTEGDVHEIRDSEELASEQREDKSSCLTEASMELDRHNMHIQTNTCENLKTIGVPSQRVSEGPQSTSNENEALVGGQNEEALPCKEEDHVPHAPLGSTGGGRDTEEQREEAGCMLWDLAATQSHAEFMVNNHILDVLLAILSVPHSDRLREICLGITGNLACHAEPVKAIVQTSGLPTKIVQSLLVDDAPSLSEACRLLSASLHSEEVDSWIKAIDSREILERVMWIAANTMNSLLLEKSTELLLAMVDCQGSTSSVLLSSLVHLGLPAVLTDLLASEISALNEGTCSHGNVVLDTVLQIAEALSLSDDVAGQLADNLKLYTLACQVIQLSGKEEVGPAGITATVLIANLLAEKEDLFNEVAEDVVLMEQLLELLPSAGDDPGVRNALWSILGRFSNAHTAAYRKGTSATTEVTLTFAHGSKILLEDLQDHGDIEDPEEAETSRGYTAKLDTVDSVVHIMEDWIASHEFKAETSRGYTAKLDTVDSVVHIMEDWIASHEF